jgi:DNA-binding transcriptional ArsR family regulator
LVADLVALDAERIARTLSDGRRISRNGDGWKTKCPICNSSSRRRKPGATLSVTVRDGKVLVYCHGCHTDPVAIIRELVHRDVLPNNFRESSIALALVDEVRAATATVSWKERADPSNLRVLRSLFKVSEQCCKEIFSASVRQVSELARVHEGTASRSLGRLVAAGWLEKVSLSRGTSAATWRLQIPTHIADRNASIQRARRAGDGLSQIDPCLTRDDRAGSSRSAPPFDHDLFRWGGLGPTKGRIYSLLLVSMTADEIAKAMDYKHTRNATLHLHVLTKEGLIRRLSDGRYERTNVDLDAVAERHGVLGARARQRARHCEERVHWKRWYSAFESWRQTGEIVDPETGEVLDTQEIPGKRGARMRAFRYRILSIRATRLEMTEAPRQSQGAATPSSTNANSRSKRRG